jgi:hydroxyacylglutathione hydrolase
MEIIQGIHRIDGIRGINCYLLFLEKKMLVIDTGMPGNAKKTISYIRALGRDPSDIEYIVLTHSDIDHIGSAAELKKITGARLAIHRDDALVLSGKSKTRTFTGPMGAFMNVVSALIPYPAIEPDLLLDNLSEIDKLSVIHTPGHTRGSICLYLPGKVIFAGDTIISDKRGNPGRNFDRVTADKEKSRASMMAIAGLEFEIMLPGHGAPVIGGACHKVRRMCKMNDFS